MTLEKAKESESDTCCSEKNAKVTLVKEKERKK